MKKKILSVMLAICVLIPCVATALFAYAQGDIINLSLNVKVASKIDEVGDVVWYQYTPTITGTYSFLSYSVPETEAYLYVKSVDESTGEESFEQLDYARIDKENYVDNEHNRNQFCLTHHLEAGVTYYFTAGWHYEKTYPVSLTVMLRCDSYDQQIVDHLEIFSDVELSAYNDGQWTEGNDGELYYLYNLSKIISSMVINVYYCDGRVVGGTGATKIDGYQVMFNHTQSANHWYPQSSDLYSANTLRVSFLDAYVDLDINIASSDYQPIKGNVVDDAGNGIMSAKIYVDGTKVATSDRYGRFAFSVEVGAHDMEVASSNSVARKGTIDISKVDLANDFSDIKVDLVNIDYVDDDVINAKDFAYITKNFSDTQLEQLTQQFEGLINFDTLDYPPLTYSN